MTDKDTQRAGEWVGAGSGNILQQFRDTAKCNHFPDPTCIHTQQDQNNRRKITINLLLNIYLQIYRRDLNQIPDVLFDITSWNWMFEDILNWNPGKEQLNKKPTEEMQQKYLGKQTSLLLAQTNTLNI